MSKLQFTVASDKCISCNACVRDCPTRIIRPGRRSAPSIAPESEANCIKCQHCLAVCPVGAISIFGVKPEECAEFDASALPSHAQMDFFLRSRRSIRQFETENVDRALIEKLLATVANAPTGCNAMALRFTVIDDRAVMQKLLESSITALEAVRKAGKLDESSFLAAAIDGYRKYKVDALFRGAPHILIVSAGPDAVCPNEDISLALAYFELLAQSAGVGTVWCGMLRFAFEAAPELKPLLGLDGQQYYYAMAFGKPKVHYARTVKRDGAAEIRFIDGAEL